MRSVYIFPTRNCCSVILFTLLAVLVGCATPQNRLGDIPLDERAVEPDYDYVIGPGDTLEIFVWGNQELSMGGVQVRPDGKITTRLVENVQASDRTPTQLAREIEEVYSAYVRDPIVTVIVHGFSGVPSQQVRVVGAAVDPRSIPYKKHMTLLDLMVMVGGLTDFAHGNRAVLIRNFNGEQRTYSVRLDDLLLDGDITANATVFPGDIVLIPQAWF